MTYAELRPGHIVARPHVGGHVTFYRVRRRVNDTLQAQATYLWAGQLAWTHILCRSDFTTRQAIIPVFALVVAV